MTTSAPTERSPIVDTGSSRIVILSNGHGEDALGAAVAREFARLVPNARLAAYPTVDRGDAYEPLGIPILGPRRPMPSGGLLMHHPRLLWGDLRAGFLRMTLRQIRDLRALDADLLFVVGDAWALTLARLVRAPERYMLQPLVSAHHGVPTGRETLRPRLERMFMERYTPLELGAAARSLRHLYVRDEPTALMLRRRGLPNVSALGNPMMDLVANDEPLERPALEGRDPRRVVALLPGTRAYARASLETMLEALERLPGATGLVAWAAGDPPDAPGGWRSVAPPEGVQGATRALERNDVRVLFLERRFTSVLRSSRIAFGTSGTANEQAAGLGVPVVAFPVPPLYSQAFLENQARLLGGALSVVPHDVDAVAARAAELLADDALHAAAAASGRERMGEAGGATRIARDVVRRSELLTWRFGDGAPPTDI